jgi:hypothetical protein
VLRGETESCFRPIRVAVHQVEVRSLKVAVGEDSRVEDGEASLQCSGRRSVCAVLLAAILAGYNGMEGVWQLCETQKVGKPRFDGYPWRIRTFPMFPLLISLPVDHQPGELFGEQIWSALRCCEYWRGEAKHQIRYRGQAVLEERESLNPWSCSPHGKPECMWYCRGPCRFVWAKNSAERRRSGHPCQRNPRN